MEYKITLDGNEQYIILETIAFENGEIINRIETNNEENIHNALNELIPSIKKVDNKTNDKVIEIPISKENAIFTILNYDKIKTNPALYDLNKRIKEIKWNKRIRTCATIFALSTAAIIKISSLQKDDDDVIPLKVEAKPIVESTIEDEITILNSDNIIYASPMDTSIELENNVPEVENLEIEETEPIFNLLEVFPEIGTKKEDERKQNVENKYGALTEKYSIITGIDQELIECLLSQERGFHSSQKDAGGAIGVAQIQVSHHEGEKLYLKNKLTGKTESFTVTKELIKDLEGNIKTCATLLQNKLDYYNGNTLVALQSYNFGYGAMDKVLEETAKKTNKTVDEIINDPTNLDWIDYLQEYSNKRGGYGDPNYCQNVFAFYTGDEFTLQYLPNDENTIIPINLENEKSHGL